MMQKTVGVVGSRALAGCPALLARLDALHGAGELAQVVSGGAAGVDALAAQWAMRNLVPLTEHLPDYAAHGRAAPLVRNGLLVAAADVVLVCWDGVSRGTLDAARRAARAGVPVEWLAAPAHVVSVSRPTNGRRAAGAGAWGSWLTIGKRAAPVPVSSWGGRRGW